MKEDDPVLVDTCQTCRCSHRSDVSCISALANEIEMLWERVLTLEREHIERSFADAFRGKGR